MCFLVFELIQLAGVSLLACKHVVRFHKYSEIPGALFTFVWPNQCIHQGSCTYFYSVNASLHWCVLDGHLYLICRCLTNTCNIALTCVHWLGESLELVVNGGMRHWSQCENGTLAESYNFRALGRRLQFSKHPARSASQPAYFQNNVYFNSCWMLDYRILLLVHYYLFRLVWMMITVVASDPSDRSITCALIAGYLCGALLVYRFWIVFLGRLVAHCSPPIWSECLLTFSSNMERVFVYVTVTLDLCTWPNKTCVHKRVAVLLLRTVLCCLASISSQVVTRA